MKRSLFALASVAGALAFGTGAAAHPDPDDQHGGSGGHLPPSSLNVQLVGKLRVAPVGPGWVADVATFRNHAYLNQFSPGCADDGRGGVYIVDISNPASPTQVGFIASSPGTFPGEGAQVIRVDTDWFSGDLLATNLETCTSTGHGGFSLYDVTNPLAPVTLVESFGDPTPGFQGGPNRYHSVFVWMQNGKAYLVGSDDEEQNTRDVDIYDISDPRNPVLIRETGRADWPGLIPTGRGNSVFNHDMVVEKLGNTWTLLSSYWDLGYVKLNVDDPANPTFIGHTRFATFDPEFPTFSPPEGNAHYAEFDRRGQFFIGTDEDFSPFRTLLEILSGPNAGRYDATEGSATRRLATLSDGMMNGSTTFLGFGCPGEGPPAVEDGDPDTEEIAVMQRGGPTACAPFQVKGQTALDLGYDGFVVFNDAARGDALVTMSVSSPLPGVFVGHSTGLKIFGVASVGDLTLGQAGEPISVSGEFDGWGYIHLFDAQSLRDIDTYAVPEAKDPAYADGFGALSIHEVTFDRLADLAYLSWYDAGFRVVRYGRGGLEEVGHYIDEGGNDLWGVQMLTTRQGLNLVAASDRDSGLYIFRYTGPR
jgi:hypothetical protein